MPAVTISYELHCRLTKKRLEIMERHGKTIDLKDMAEVAIIEGWDAIEKKLVLTENKHGI